MPQEKRPGTVFEFVAEVGRKFPTVDGELHIY
jgi:hypothetical protein